jgi:multicomponent K+:H+ antiporter subunit E
MKRWLPFPLLSAALLATWLVLNQSLAPAQVLLGGLLALGGGRMLGLLQPPTGRARFRAAALAALLWLVFVDIVRSNLAVFGVVLRPAGRGRVAGFLAMPLEVRHPGALAVLACVITATPGTSWARYDAARNVLTIHVLDLVDEQAWIRQFKQRYERRLKEIFE